MSEIHSLTAYSHGKPRVLVEDLRKYFGPAFNFKSPSFERPLGKLRSSAQQAIPNPGAGMRARLGDEVEDAVHSAVDQVQT